MRNMVQIKDYGHSLVQVTVDGKFYCQCGEEFKNSDDFNSHLDEVQRIIDRQNQSGSSY